MDDVLVMGFSGSPLLGTRVHSADDAATVLRTVAGLVEGADHMAGVTGSLDLVLAEVRAEREAHTVHADAVDTKAGVVLGFAGAVAAVGAQRITLPSALGVAVAVVAALLALAVILQHRFPAWELSDLRGYLGADTEFTQLRMLDATVVMVQQLNRVLRRKVLALRGSVVALATAVILVAGSTIFD